MASYAESRKQIWLKKMGNLNHITIATKTILYPVIIMQACRGNLVSYNAIYSSYCSIYVM